MGDNEKGGRGGVVAKKMVKGTEIEQGRKRRVEQIKRKG